MLSIFIFWTGRLTDVLMTECVPPLLFTSLTKFCNFFRLHAGDAQQISVGCVETDLISKTHTIISMRSEVTFFIISRCMQPFLIYQNQGLVKGAEFCWSYSYFFLWISLCQTKSHSLILSTNKKQVKVS